MAAIAVVVAGGGSGIEPTAPMAVSSTVAAVDGSGDNGVFTTTSYDDNRILALIALTLVLPWTRIGQRGGWHAMMHLIRCCHAKSWLHVACSSCLGVIGACGYHNE
jgi:hypothetical protein